MSSPIQHLVSVSGGKDSTATYLLAMESGRPFRAVFADTGNEHELTLEYVDRLHERTGGPRVDVVRADFTKDLARHKSFILEHWPAEGIPQLVVEEAAALHEPTGVPFLDLCILKGRFPSRRAQFCTEELKVIPIATQAVGPMLKAGPVLQWLGIRAEESDARAVQPRYNRHESGSMVWRPIFSYSEDDVWAMHRKHALRPNPLYAMRMRRVGCMLCINCAKQEVRLSADQFPEHIEKLARWESIVARVSKRRAASFFAPKNGDILPIHKIVQWSRTAHGGRQYDMFFAEQAGGGCTSNQGLCERTRREAA